MSGFEIAGIILGTIPLLVKTVEGYADGVSTIKRLVKYKRELSGIVRRLNSETTILKGTLRELLIGVLHPDEIERLFNNDDYKMWSHPIIQQVLRERLQDEYDIYVQNLQDMGQAVEEMRARLKVDVVEEKLSSKPASFGNLYKAVRFGISRRDYEDLLNRIREDNNFLKHITDQRMRLELLIEPNRRLGFPKFDEARSLARGLVRALRSSFTCTEPHRVSILLQQPDLRSTNMPNRNSSINSDTTFELAFSRGCADNGDEGMLGNWKFAMVEVMRDGGEDKLKRQLDNRGVAGRRRQKVTHFAVPSVPDFQPAEGQFAHGSTASPEVEPITSMCNAIVQYWPPRSIAPFKGLLFDAQMKQRYVVMPKTPGMTTVHLISLADLLQQARRDRDKSTFQRLEKKRLAFILAFGILNVGETPWMTLPWKSNTIMFSSASQGVDCILPYAPAAVSGHNSDDSKMEESGVARFGARHSPLFDLGILLLELALGQPYYELYLPDELNPDGTEMETSKWRLVNRLMGTVGGQEGSRYSEVVRRCFSPNFHRNKSTLEDPEFRKAVYESVVCLLEEDLRQFEFGDND